MARMDSVGGTPAVFFNLSILELVMIIALIVLFARMAAMDDNSPVIWGVVTGVVCVGVAFIPLPVLRIGIAGVVVFSMMIGWRVISDR